MKRYNEEMLKTEHNDPYRHDEISFLKNQRTEKEEALKQMKEKEKKCKKSIN